jgi:hypothetical protein
VRDVPLYEVSLAMHIASLWLFSLVHPASFSLPPAQGKLIFEEKARATMFV